MVSVESHYLFDSEIGKEEEKGDGTYGTKAHKYPLLYDVHLWSSCSS